MEDNRPIIMSCISRPENERPIRDGKVHFEETPSGLTKVMSVGIAELKVDFEKIIETIDTIQLLSEEEECFEGSQEDIRNLHLFITKLSQSSSFAHKAHKELQRIMR